MFQHFGKGTASVWPNKNYPCNKRKGTASFGSKDLPTFYFVNLLTLRGGQISIISVESANFETWVFASPVKALVVGRSITMTSKPQARRSRKNDRCESCSRNDWGCVRRSEDGSCEVCEERGLECIQPNRRPAARKRPKTEETHIISEDESVFL